MDITFDGKAMIVALTYEDKDTCDKHQATEPEDYEDIYDIYKLWARQPYKHLTFQCIVILYRNVTSFILGISFYGCPPKSSRTILLILQFIGLSLDFHVMVWHNTCIVAYTHQPTLNIPSVQRNIGEINGLL